MTVAELLKRISSKELTEWYAYYVNEPFGHEVRYLGSAITSTVIANSNRKKGDPPHKLTEFIPKFEGSEKQSISQQIQIAEMVTLQLGGQDLRKDEEE